MKIITVMEYLFHGGDKCVVKKEAAAVCAKSDFPYMLCFLLERQLMGACSRLDKHFLRH